MTKTFMPYVVVPFRGFPKKTCGFTTDKTSPDFCHPGGYLKVNPNSPLEYVSQPEVSIDCVEVETGGHAANSQFGPVRPTALPSGQSFASIVQATCPEPEFLWI